VIFHFARVPAASDAEQKTPPFDTWSIEATSFAVWIGSRCCTRQTPVPTFMHWTP